MLEPPPPGVTKAYQTLFTPDAVNFVTELVTTFDDRVEDVSANYLH